MSYGLEGSIATYNTTAVMAFLTNEKLTIVGAAGMIGWPDWRMKKHLIWKCVLRIVREAKHIMPSMESVPLSRMKEMESQY